MTGMAAAVVTTTTNTNSTATSTSSHSRTSYQTSKTQDTVRHLLTDDGHGSFGPDGTISYAGKFANVRFVQLDSKTEGYNSDFEDAKTFESTSMSGGGGDPGSSSSSSKGGERSDTSVSEEILAASTVTLTYAEGFASPQHHVMSYTPEPLTLDLCPYTTDYIVPNSVRFRWMGQVYEDYDGVLVRGRTAISPGIVAGALDYSSGVARITDYVVGGSPTDFAVESLWTVRQNWTTASIFMRTAASPVKPSGFVMNLSDATGAQITAIAGIDGLITGDHLRGRIDYQTGVVELQFGDYVLDTSLTAAQKAEWWYSADDVGAVQPDKIWRPWPVDPTTLRYNSVSYFYLPLDETVIGLDPVRLPQDGRVPIYRVGGYLVIGHTGKIGPAQLTNGQTLNCGRTRLSRVYLVGADSKLIHQGWTVDLDAGLVSVQDTTGWVQPVRVFHRIEEMARASDVQISGAITLTKSLSHEFPVGSIVSNALMSGTLRARVSHLFDQNTWTGRWQDTVDGAEALASYNDTVAPIQVTNAGAIPQRWMLRFKDTTNFECIGQDVGNIGSGSINTDFAPINPISAAPYFTVRAIGWGQGWAAGNVLRINTVGAMQPFAAIRTVQPSEAAGTDHAFELLTRGDVDRPPTNPQTI
ncbi:hypothetical protein DR66_4027 [Delftia acidovorans]|uniref:hypothetical protein n=1 Tax=Delftia acidovorans TaxID=80866 RepID=UPI000502B101|nr:hypothetical protein [Delftia acidovorans]KFJ12784.1 hypothetical protein DR66_4027 [Delftia acidovorans]QQB53368.1 hypothetical protein I6H54_14445 [Delftia acidovorans]